MQTTRTKLYETMLENERPIQMWHWLKRRKTQVKTQVKTQLKTTCVFQIKPYVTQGGSVDNDALEWDSRNEPIEMQASTSDITKLHLRRGGLIIFHCVAYVSGHWEHQKTPFQKYKIEAIINRPCPKDILVNASLKTQNATHGYT